MSTWLWSPMLIWERQILDIHIGRGLIYGDDLSSCEISKGWARRLQTCTAEHKPKVTMHQRTQYILDDASGVNILQQPRSRIVHGAGYSENQNMLQ